MKVKMSGVAQAPTDLNEIYGQFAEEYDQVFMQKVCDEVFIFKPLGRKDFKQLLDIEAIDDCDKEEVVCETCTLYPKNYDFENCEMAGLPTELCKVILDKSLLKDSKQLQEAIHFFRDKLNNDLNEQITCIIHEAFPEYTIEEISNWDVIKTADYMTRAEYILHNLRGVPLTPVQMETPDTTVDMSEFRELPPQQPVRREAPRPAGSQPPASAQAEKEPVHNDGKVLHKGDKLTPQRLAELQRLYPDINWAADSVRMQGVAALRNQHFDDRPIAEIPTDGSEDGQEAIPEALRNRFKVIPKS